MDVNKLYQLVIAGNRGKLCDALAPLSEKERKVLDDDAWELYVWIGGASGPSRFKVNKDQRPAADADGKRLEKLRTRKYADWRIPRWTASLAVLALCNEKRIRQPQRGTQRQAHWLHSDWSGMPQRVLQVLEARRPSWLARFVEAEVKKDLPVVSWLVERGLIRSGTLPANRTDGYIQRMADDESFLVRQDEIKTDNLETPLTSWKQLLLADPELLDDEVWRLFEVENNAFCYWFDRWAPALQELSDGGHLDRARLLQASIRGGAVPRKHSAQTAFAKFHEYLEPTLEERETLVSEYLYLLEVNIPGIVGFALNSLELLAKEKRLAAETFLPACPSVFRLDKKKQPNQAIKLIKLLIKQDPACTPAALLASTHALACEIPDVQEAAVKLLEANSEFLTPAAVDVMDGLVGNIAAILKPRVEALITGARKEKSGELRNPQSATKKPSAKHGRAAKSKTSLEDRIAGLPEPILEQCGVLLVLAWINDDSEPHVPPIDPRFVPRLDPAKKIEPLASFDELVDAVAALCEGIENVMEIERIVDGIARFHHQPPWDFDKRVDPLRKRVEKQTHEDAASVMERYVDVGLTQVIRRWLKLPPIERELFSWQDLGESLYKNRMQELCWYLDDDDHQPRGLLSLPTHKGGWIDPVVLVRRIQEDCVAKDEMPDQFDLAQAILRLSVEGREEALELLCEPVAGAEEHEYFDKPGEPNYYNGGHQLFYALSTDIDFSSTGGYGCEALDPAAVRARALLEDPESFVPSLPLARVGLDAKGEVILRGPVAADSAIPPDFLPVVFRSSVEFWPNRNTEGRDWRVEWQQLCHPFDNRPLLLMGGAHSGTSRSYLEPLFDADVVWGAEASRAAIMGAAANTADVRALTTDALIEAIGGMLVDPGILGQQLANVYEKIKINRVAAVLKDVSSVSPLHHWFVFGAIDAALAKMNDIPSDVHHVLEVMLESAAVIGKAVSDLAAEKLKSIEGSGKAAKLARNLLKLSNQEAGMTEVRQAAAERVVQRAERWSHLRQSHGRNE